MSEYSPISCLAESRVDSGKDFFEAGVFLACFSEPDSCRPEH